MCFGMQTTAQENKTETTSRTPDQWLTDAAKQNLAFSQGVQNTPVVPYDFQRVAANGALQNQAADFASNLLGSYANNPDVAAARNMFTAAGSAGPQSVSAPQIGAQSGITPKSVMDGLQGYMSQYTQAALDPTIRGIQTAGAQARHGAGGIDSLATSAGAFGDARHGVELAENTKNTNQQIADATAQAYDRAFTQAAGLSQFDKSNDLNAQQFNSTQNMQRLLANAGFDMQGQMANAGFNEQALARMLGSGSALSGLGANSVAQGMGLTQLVSGIGGQQQGVNQAALDASYQEFLRRQNDPFLRAQVGNAGFSASVPGAGYTGTGSATVEKQQPNNSGLSLLGSVIGSALPLMFSDRRLKEDIKKVGKLDNGLSVYSYNYKADPAKRTHIGVMAQEVEKKNPGAVHTIAGFKAVDYEMATAA